MQLNSFAVNDIDSVIYSHHHWGNRALIQDHIGDFDQCKQSALFVGPGIMKAAKGGYPANVNSSLLQSSITFERTRETSFDTSVTHGAELYPYFTTGKMKVKPVNEAIDLFCDGSVYVVNLPGHSIGHIGLLLRIALS
jgi:glyoxylase-like metal-dependent hydrolase (beta-lactamase superfamily II)